MIMANIRRSAVGSAAAVAVAVLSACGGASNEASEGEEAAGLATLRRITTGFEDVAVARAAGYNEQITSCWYHRELGGQGYHFARSELIDGTVSVAEPELVMYEPLPDGRLQFLAVEYIVPFSEWERPDPPALLGREFGRNEQLEIWVLHVWLGKENPSGLYSNWNPNVSCASAAESEDRA